MLKVALLGYGKMGKAIEELADRMGVEIVARFNEGLSETSLKELKKAEVCLDFTNAEGFLSNVQQVLSCNIPYVVGTTGWYEKMGKVRSLVESSQGALLWGENFSLGITLFSKIVKQAAEWMAPFEEFDVALFESHHRYKQDRPSGTSLGLAKCVELIYGKPIEISSLRVGGECGIHEVIFDANEEKICLQHTSRNRNALAKGALFAAHWLAGKRGFFHFSEVLNR